MREADLEELRRQLGSSAPVIAEIVTDVKDRLPDLQSPPQMADSNSARFRLFDSITSFMKTALEFNERGLERNPEGGRLQIQRLILQVEAGDIEGAFDALDEMDRVHREAWSGTEGTTASVLAVGAATIAGVSNDPTLVDIARRTAGFALNSDGLIPVFREQARVGLGLLAAVQGDAEEADRMYREIEARQGNMAPIHILYTDHVLGLLAATTGRYDVAERHMTDARSFYETRGYRPALARVLADHAEMLLDRDGSGDREKAIALQDAALATTQETGMGPLTERILARREFLRA